MDISQHIPSLKTCVGSLTVGCGLEQKTVYFLMMPFTLDGGSQDTKTTESDAAAAFTPAGGPGTGRTRASSSHLVSMKMWRLPCLERGDCIPTVFLGAGVDLVTANAVSSSGKSQDLDAVVGVFLQPVQLQRWFACGHILDLSQFCWKKIIYFIYSLRNMHLF